MVTVKELRDRLMLLGVSEEEANSIKDKALLSQKVEELESKDLESLMNNLSEMDLEPSEETEKEEEFEAPEYGDPNWQEYVLSFFYENELYDNKYPTLNGMRRVAQILLGELESSGVISLQASMPEDNNGRAYCVYELIFSDFLGRGRKVFRAAADAHQFNMNDTYCIYPVAIAENRSEVRAYRKALMLSVVGAEEMKEANVGHFESVLSTNADSSNGKASSTQMVIIKTKTDALKIDFSKVVTNNMTKEEATNLIKNLNSYQSDTTKIPEDIKLQ